MEFRDELLTIAEISVTIAGFAGVVSVFQRPGGEFHRIDRVRFVNTFAAAFTALVLSFVPIAVSEISGGDPWAISSGVMIVAWCISTAMATRVLRYRNDFAEPFRPNPAIVYPSLLNLVVQILNATGWLFTPSPIAYLFGLLVYLYAAGVFFLFFVLYRPKE